MDINRYWGKLRKEGDQVTAFHPLEDHCADVAACAEAILQVPVVKARMESIAGFHLGEDEVARLSFLTALHDLGKFNSGFQNKYKPKAPSVGHVAPFIGLKNHREKYYQDIVRVANINPQEESLLFASICHHGKAQREGDPPISSRWKNCIQDLLDFIEVAKGWFPHKPCKLPTNNEFVHAFSGLVTLADWIGSDTDFFPYSEAGDGSRIEFARDAAGKALKAIGFVFESSFTGESILREGWLPRPAQKKIQELPLDPNGSLTIIEAETGSGKTEAALIHYQRLREAGLVEGLYFALPTRSAATQIFERVKYFVRTVFVEPPPVVLAIPGYFRVDDAQGKPLPDFDVLWPDEFESRGWAGEHPKRYLSGAIVVGTIDQALLTGLKVKHAHLPGFSLLRHLLIVDEVHASDDYMTMILKEIVGRFRKSKGHVLLLSATLGSRARAEFVGESLNYEDACNMPYPMVWHNGVVHDLSQESTDKKTVHSILDSSISDFDAIAADVVNQARKGGKVLIIRNTVTDCVKLFRAIEQQDPTHLLRCRGIRVPHHSRYSAQDRKLLDKALEDAFKTEGPLIVCATQTVEQSLDIDCDYLVTDICPIDVLLQRIGRLHRHPRTRPESFEVPTVRVLYDPDFKSNHGCGKVYSKLMIRQTSQSLLQDPTIIVPDQCRERIEFCTHLSQVSLEADFFEFEGGKLAQRKAGMNARLEWGLGFDRQRTVPAPTRLGEKDRVEVITAKGPFGGKHHRLRIPHYMKIGTLSVQETENGFTLDNQHHYDRLGLQCTRS